MIAWWQQRNPRERGLLIGGGLFLALMLFYFGYWLPMEQTKQRLLARQQQMQSQWQQMQNQWQAIQKAQLPGFNGVSRWRAVLNQQLQQLPAQVGKLQKVNFTNNNQAATATIQPRQAGMTLLWLQQLQNRYGFVVSGLLATPKTWQITWQFDEG